MDKNSLGLTQFLAPIDNYTNLPFRLLCQEYGAQTTCVPLISSTGIIRQEVSNLVKVHAKEKNLGLQLVGREPEEIGQAIKKISNEISFIEWYNLNCGCPSTTTKNCGCGSALLNYPNTIAESVKYMRKYSPCRISVKIRLSGDIKKTLELCKGIEAAGADFLIVHGRTASQGYSGKSDWHQIKQISQILEIPVIGNGDIVSVAHGEQLMLDGYCDGYMVARAAMRNPAIFSGIHVDNLSMIKRYLDIYWEYMGEPNLSDIKLKAVNMISGMPDACVLRNAICRVTSIDELMMIIEKIETNNALTY